MNRCSDACMRVNEQNAASPSTVRRLDVDRAVGQGQSFASRAREIKETRRAKEREKFNSSFRRKPIN